VATAVRSGRGIRCGAACGRAPNAAREAAGGGGGPRRARRRTLAAAPRRWAVAGGTARADRLGAPRRGGPRAARLRIETLTGAGDGGVRRRPRGPRRGVRARTNSSRSSPTPTARHRPRRAGPEPTPVRPGGPGEATAVGRAQARRSRPDQPARAGGVCRAGGAARLPHHPAGRPQASKRDLLDIVKEVDERVEQASSPRPSTTRPRSSRRCSRGCSPAARGGCCSPTPTTC
jgi:hypothetical protein